MIRYSFNFVTLSLTGVKMSIFFTFADNFDSQECTVLAFISVSLTLSLKTRFKLSHRTSLPFSLPMIDSVLIVVWIGAGGGGGGEICQPLGWYIVKWFDKSSW